MANIRELADQFTAAFNAHDLDALDRLTDPNCEMEAPGGQRYRGLRELRSWNESWITAFPNCRINVVNLIDAGRTAVVECVFEGTHKGVLRSPMGDIPPTGKELRGPFVQITNYDDSGLAASVHLYYDVADIMTQLGLLPAPAAAQA